jgi:hypothetical protein
MKLINEQLGSDLRVGTAFLLEEFGPAKAPTLLLLSKRAAEEDDLMLVVAGGHKRGYVLVLIPAEAYTSEQAISRKWLVENWKHWIDPASDPMKVEVISDLLLSVALNEAVEAPV